MKLSASILLLPLLAAAAPIPDPLRKIDGKVVAARGPGWVIFGGDVVGVHPDGLRIQGAYFAPDFSHTFTGEFFITHFPYATAIGDTISADRNYTARLAGTHTHATSMAGPRTLHQLDYGIPFKPPAPDPASQAAARADAARAKKDAAARALKLNQDQAAACDPYGQFRMGERYRDADGVPRDLVKARELFAAAAAQGHSAALAALARLTNIPSVGPIPTLTNRPIPIIPSDHSPTDAHPGP